jgi:Tfp pilus assembly protein PilX
MHRLLCRRGETLMEALVSILVFTILLAAVTTTVVVSMRITGRATADANAMQEATNAALRGVGESRCEDIWGFGVTVTENGGFIAFMPCSMAEGICPVCGE